MLVGNKADAEDLVQETFLQVLRSLDGFHGECKLETWLYAILMKQHQQKLRRDARSWRRWLTWFEQMGMSRNRDVASASAEDEWRNGIWSEVAKLTDIQQQVVVLRYSEDLSYEQIADVMQCPVGYRKVSAIPGARSFGTTTSGKKRISQHSNQWQAAGDNEGLEMNNDLETPGNRRTAAG